MSYFENKTVVITGGSGVLCREFAKAMASEGAKVAVLGRTLSKLDEVVKEIEENGGTAMSVVCDVVSEESVDAAKKIINEKFGKTDILINGAGGNNAAANTQKDYFEAGDKENDDVKSFFDVSLDGFRYVFDVNITGTVIPTKAFMTDLIETKGNVLNISSMSAYHPMTRVAAYSAAKAAVSNFTEWVAVHFAKAGVRCNAMAPGFFLTQQNHDLLVNPDGTNTSRADKIIAGTPMGRFGEPEELIGTLLWITDNEKAGFVTGIVVPVDGGFNAYSGV